MSRFRGQYPPDWDEIGDRVRAEAGNRCVRCGHPQGDRMVSLATVGKVVGSFDSLLMPCDERCTHPQDGKLRVLTVHHLDNDKANVRWWNLAALCQVCHLQIQGKVQVGQAYLHPHTEWFRPYVAGFYAFTILGEDLTRAEVEARLEELLRAGQPWLVDVL